MIYVGTSGYSYDDWVGPHPPGLPKKDWLSFYAQSSAPVRSTIPTIGYPAPRRGRHVGKTPEGFCFTVKASKELTHEREDADAFAAFRAGIEPLVRTASWAASWPSSLLFSRHAGIAPTWCASANNWPACPSPSEPQPRLARAETFDLLTELGLGFCAVDGRAWRASSTGGSGHERHRLCALSWPQRPQVVAARERLGAL